MQKSIIKIDTSSIPDHARDSLAEATLELVKNILAQPNGRQLLGAKIAKRGMEDENGGESSNLTFNPKTPI